MKSRAGCPPGAAGAAAADRSHGGPPPGAGERPDAARRRLRRIAAVLVLAVLILAGELVWFSAPVQDWWIGKQPLASLEVMAAGQPGSTRIRFFYAAKLVAAGRADEAFRQAQEAITMEPGTARLHRAAGMAAGAQGRSADAEALLSRAEALGDRYPGTFEALARLRMDRNEFGAAVGLLEPSLSRHPRRAESWFLLGQCRGALGMSQGWTAAMQRAVELAPGNPAYWLGLAESWLFRDDAPQALAAADRALALAAADPLAWLARGRALALAARAPAQVNEAEAAFRRAIDGQGRVPDTEIVGLRHFGTFLLDHGRFDRAAAILDRAWRANPDDQAAAYALAQAHRRSGKPQRADSVLRQFEARFTLQRDLRYLESRVIAHPAAPEAHRAYARVLEKAGRKQQAAAEYALAEQLRSAAGPRTPGSRPEGTRGAAP